MMKGKLSLLYLARGLTLATEDERIVVCVTRNQVVVVAPKSAARRPSFDRGTVRSEGKRGKIGKPARSCQDLILIQRIAKGGKKIQNGIRLICIVSAELPFTW